MGNLSKQGWKPYKLNDLGFVGRGKSKHRPRNDPSLYGGIHPFFQTGDVKNAEMYMSNYSQTYNDEGLAQSKIWKKGTLCITIAANIAETAILAVDGCFPDSVVGFVADPDKCDTKFVKYYIDFIKLQMQSISRGTTQDNLSLDKLLTFEFLTPSLPIQRKIASVLSTYDDLIENNTRRIKILEEMAQAIYREWFVNFRFPGHEKVRMVDSELGQIPERWEVKPVAHFGQVVTGKTPSKKVPEYYGEYMPFIKTPDMHSNIFCTHTSEYLSQSGVESQKTKTLPTNSICVSCIGTVGVVSITSQPSQTNQQINSLVLRNQPEREFLYFSLLGLRDIIMRYGATGATMANLSKGKFESLQIVCPTKEVTASFHEAVLPHFEMVRVLQLKNTNLHQTRDLLLPKLISGEVSVEDLDINSEEVSEPNFVT